VPAPHLNLTALSRALSSRTVRVGFVVVTVALGAYAVVSEWEQIRQALDRLSIVAIGAAGLAIVIGLVASMAVWRTLLSGLGSKLPWPVAVRVLFISQLGKYIPGSVWPMVAQMELGRDHGVPRRRSATAFVLLMFFNLTTGLLVACATLPFAAIDFPLLRWAFVLTPVLLIGFHPRVLNPMLGLLLRLAKRPPLEQPLQWRTCFLAAGTLVVQWIFLGMHILALVTDLGADPAESALLSIGGFALAWAIGPLLVIAPAGLGLREVTMVAVLSPAVGSGNAIVVAVTSRVLMTITDLLLAGLSAISLRKKRATLEAPSSVEM
jgi:uncharacterized membrane protein YbhN (UPF0104 family)